MGWERDYENWRDSIHCGGRERPREFVEAEIGARYEVYDYIEDRVTDVVVCTEENKRHIAYILNDPETDIWTYRKIEEE